jgi:hypothetical protein
MLLVRNIVKSIFSGILFFQNYCLTSLALGLWPKLRGWQRGMCQKSVNGFQTQSQVWKNESIGCPLSKVVGLQCFKYFKQGLGGQSLSKLGPFRSSKGLEK